MPVALRAVIAIALVVLFRLPACGTEQPPPAEVVSEESEEATLVVYDVAADTKGHLVIVIQDQDWSDPWQLGSSRALLYSAPPIGGVGIPLDTLSGKFLYTGKRGDDLLVKHFNYKWQWRVDDGRFKPADIGVARELSRFRITTQGYGLGVGVSRPTVLTYAKTPRWGEWLKTDDLVTWGHYGGPVGPGWAMWEAHRAPPFELDSDGNLVVLHFQRLWFYALSDWAGTEGKLPSFSRTRIFEAAENEFFMDFAMLDGKRFAILSKVLVGDSPESPWPNGPIPGGCDLRLTVIDTAGRKLSEERVMLLDTASSRDPFRVAYVGGQILVIEGSFKEGADSLAGYVFALESGELSYQGATSLRLEKEPGEGGQVSSDTEQR